ncbi:ferredoxin [Actinomadura keratinilytica]|jgi:ferredoxin|uniref:Ferredoxin n=1 Tax=Actinomadura keratinilytica TaxID=547461 RepID=A0ABP7YP15_9ACTN
MSISADRDRCIGSGQCVLSAPHVFDSDDDGLVVVVDPDRTGDRAVREAAVLCPVGAITVAAEG